MKTKIETSTSKKFHRAALKGLIPILSIIHQKMNEGMKVYEQRIFIKLKPTTDEIKLIKGY